MSQKKETAYNFIALVSLYNKEKNAPSEKDINQLCWKAQMKLDLTKKQEMMMLMLCSDVWVPLKVSKSRKQTLKFSFEPKNKQTYFCISALA